MCLDVVEGEGVIGLCHWGGGGVWQEGGNGKLNGRKREDKGGSKR